MRSFIYNIMSDLTKTKKLVKLDIVLENVEFLEFNSDDILNLSIDGVTETLYYQLFDQNMFRFKKCSHLYLKVQESANSISNTTYEPEKKFDRLLRCFDITQIELHFNDMSSEIFYVEYSDRILEINDYQETFLDNKGNLIVIISKDIAYKDAIKRENL